MDTRRRTELSFADTFNTDTKVSQDMQSPTSSLESFFGLLILESDLIVDILASIRIVLINIPISSTIMPLPIWHLSFCIRIHSIPGHVPAMISSTFSRSSSAWHLS